MTDQDIRAWAERTGNLPESGRVTKAVRDKYATENESGEVSVEFEDTPMPQTSSERPPDVSGDSPVTRARGLLKRTGERRKTRTRSTVKKTHPRVAVDRLIGRGWEMMARAVQPVNLPVARVLHMQAPIAGMILEDEIKGSFIDRVLQPLARTEKRGETVFALVGPPILVGVLTSKPQLAPVVVPMLKESLAVWLDIAGPKLEVQAERTKEFQEKYGDQIDAIIAMILAPVEEMVSDNAG